ncbi:MAG: hypothetical protein WEB63_08175 [Cucumibacter sp.]
MIPDSPDRPAPDGAVLRAPDAPIDWQAIKRDYEAGKSAVTAIEARYGVTQAQLYWRADQDGWTKRRRFARVSRTQLIARLFHVLETQISKLEERMTQKPFGEQEVRILSNMSRSLDKLIEMDKAERKGKVRVRSRTGRSMEDLRRELTERIVKLSQR